MKKVIFILVLNLIFCFFVACEKSNTESGITDTGSVIAESSLAQESEEQISQSVTDSQAVESGLDSKPQEQSKISDTGSKNTSGKVSQTGSANSSFSDNQSKKPNSSDVSSKSSSKVSVAESVKTSSVTSTTVPPKVPVSSSGASASSENTSSKVSVSSTIQSVVSKNPIIPTPEEVIPPNEETQDKIDYTTKANYGYTYDTTKSQKHNWLPAEEKYCYSLLNQSEKAIYKKIDKAVKNLESEVIFGTGVTFEQISKIFDYYEYDNPEHFYFQYRGGAYYEINGEFSAKIHYNFGEIKDFPQDFEGLSTQQIGKLKERISKFNKAVNDIISTIPANAPDVVKQILIYDRLLIDSKYNLSAAEAGDTAHQDNFTPYGVLVNKTGVCESYSEAFQLLCNAVGINCTLKRSDNHQWNAVKIDGEWYECDVTFDDPINIKDGIVYGHTYFNRTTAFMSQCHPEIIIYNTPVCTATKYDFLKYFHKK